MKTPPAAIAPIRRGVFFEAVSLDLFYRVSSWIAVDLDRAEIVTVERYPDTMLREVVETRKKEKDPQRVSIQRPDADNVDYVRRYPVPAPRIGEVVCAANKLWKAGDGDLVDATTGGYSGLYLVDVAASRTFSGLGILRGDAKALHDLMDSLKEPGWDWYLPLR